MRFFFCTGFLIEILVLGNARVAFAEDARFDATVETGTRSSVEDLEEGDLDTQYTYHNTRFKTQFNGSERSHFKINTFTGEKNYKIAKPLNNQTTQNQAGFSYTLRPEALLWGMDFAVKTKRYQNQSTDSYDRGTAVPFFTKTQKDLYRFTVSAGFDRYDYLKSILRDQNAYFGKLEGSRHLLDKKLTLISSLRGTIAEKKISQRKKDKGEFIGKGEYHFDRPLLRRAALRVKLGQKDTRSEDEQDIDYDYRYSAVQGTTAHEINEATDTDFTLESTHRRYRGDYPGHRMWRIENGWKHVFFKNDKGRWWASITGEYKKVRFETLGKNYHRKSAALDTVYLRTKNWRTGLTLETHRYTYESGPGKTRYYGGFSFENKFSEEAFIITTELKYRLTRNDHQNEKEQKGIKLGLGYLF